MPVRPRRARGGCPCGFLRITCLSRLGRTVLLWLGHATGDSLLRANCELRWDNGRQDSRIQVALVGETIQPSLAGTDHANGSNKDGGNEQPRGWWCGPTTLPGRCRHGVGPSPAWRGLL